MVPFRYTFDDIVQLVKPMSIHGSMDSSAITGIASLEKACPGDLSFLGNLKYKSKVLTTNASVLLLPAQYVGTPKEGQVFLIVEQPSSALDAICRDILQKTRPKCTPGIHPTAVIDPSATVSPEAFIGPLCTVGADTIIEAGVHLHAHVFVGKCVKIQSQTFVQANVSILDDTQIGRHCYIDAGVVLGSEGYGYETEKGAHRRSPQLGRVVLEDEVDIGANTTIDRARFDETRIGEGTKIDNLVQIGHNVTIGKHCFVVAFVGIAGSTHIGDYATIGGQVGIAGHLTIGDRVMIGAQSGVSHDLPSGSIVRGAPVLPYMLAHRIDNLKRRLPDLFRRMGELEEVIAYLTNGAAAHKQSPQKLEQ